MTLSVPVKTEQLNMLSEYSTTIGCVLYMSFLLGSTDKDFFALFSTFLKHLTTKYFIMLELPQMF